MAKKKTKAIRHGGARKGSGRKSQFEEPMRDCTVKLPEKVIDAIQRQADAEGVTWVGWCRKVLMAEVARKK